MKNQVLKLIVIIATTFIVIACSKEESTDPKGDDGNANVIYTPWVNRVFTSTSPSNWQINYTMPQITQNRLDSALIITYRKFAGYVDPIPTYFPNTIEVYYGVNSVTHYSNFNATAEYRTIIIPSNSPKI